MIEAARQANVQRFFYASSACIYPEYKQVFGWIGPGRGVVGGLGGGQGGRGQRRLLRAAGWERDPAGSRRL